VKKKEKLKNKTQFEGNRKTRTELRIFAICPSGGAGIPGSFVWGFPLSHPKPKPISTLRQLPF